MIAGSLAQLAALGVIGPAVFTVLFTLLGVGLGLVPLLGVGLLLLYVLVYAMYATAWLEYARVDGLYGLELPPVRVRRSSRPGFGGFLRMVWAQFTDPIVWRGIASIAVSTVLGLLVVPLLTAVIVGIAGAFAPLYAGATAGSINVWSSDSLHPSFPPANSTQPMSSACPSKVRSITPERCRCTRRASSGPRVS